MQLRLNQGDMGVVSLKEKILLDDMEGIRIAGSGALHILAAGEVKIAGSEVRVAGTGGVLLYEGTAEADQEGNIVVAPQGKIELSAEDGERAIHNRGKEVTYYLAWEHEDLSHPSNRYRDAPQQKDYDWMKLGTHVAAGLMVAGGIAALAAGGVFLVGAAAATAAKIGMTVFLAGRLYVGEQALSDITSGRVSDLDQYTRKVVAGSVVGFLTGASGLLMAEASLGGVLALGFGEGLVGSVVTQKLLNEDGEIDWGVAIAEAGFSAVTAGFAWKERRSVRGVGGGRIDSYDEFSKLASDIGKRTDLTDSQKITELQNLFENSNYKVDINIAGDIQYVKGFDAKTIKSISRTDGLPNTWDGYGYMGGSNFSDVPSAGKYTYSERAIPYAENQAAYHIGTFNSATYFDKIDAIKNKDIDTFNELLQNEGISKWDWDDFEELCDNYDSFILKVNKELGDSVDATYGIKGIAAGWGDMSGGAGQIVTPFGVDALKK